MNQIPEPTNELQQRNNDADDDNKRTNELQQRNNDGDDDDDNDDDDDDSTLRPTNQPTGIIHRCTQTVTVRVVSIILQKDGFNH